MLYPFCILSGRYDRTAGRQARMVGGIWAKVSSIVYTSIFRSISIVPQRVSTAVYTFWRCSGFPYQVVFRLVERPLVWREASSSCNFITVSKIVYTSIPHVISISPQGCKGLFTPPLFLSLFHKCLYINIKT